MMSSLARRAAMAAARTPAFSRAVSFVEGIGEPPTGLLRVLTYHRVDESEARPALSPGVLSGTPGGFEVQMRHIAAHYNAISLPDLLRSYLDGQALPPRSVLITFDDAYRDFQENAWPVMRRLGLPAMLFVPTAYPDDPSAAFWWDRLYQATRTAAPDYVLETPSGRFTLGTPEERQTAWTGISRYLKTIPHSDLLAFVERLDTIPGVPPPEHHVLTWSELRQLAREGVTLAAHTRTHPRLDRIGADEVRAEITGSLRDLEREIGAAPPVFAYPGGAVSDTAVQALHEAGVRLAFSTVRGVNDPRRMDPLRLRRVNVGRRTNLPMFRAQLAPGAALLNGCWERIGA